MPFRLEAGSAAPPFERVDDFPFFVDAEIFGIELLPCPVEAIEFGAAGRQKGKPFQPFVVRQKGKHLLFKLSPGAAGDDRDVDDPEQPAQKSGHLRIELDLLSASVPSRSKMIRLFMRAPARRFPIGKARSERRRPDWLRRNADGLLRRGKGAICRSATAKIRRRRLSPLGRAVTWPAPCGSIVIRVHVRRSFSDSSS